MAWPVPVGLSVLRASIDSQAQLSLGKNSSHATFFHDPSIQRLATRLLLSGWLNQRARWLSGRAGFLIGRRALLLFMMTPPFRQNSRTIFPLRQLGTNPSFLRRVGDAHRELRRLGLVGENRERVLHACSSEI